LVSPSSEYRRQAFNGGGIKSVGCVVVGVLLACGSKIGCEFLDRECWAQVVPQGGVEAGWGSVALGE
jgi:uncharacterized membrane protein YgdD (TMEM256/DUF423 family)